MSPTQFKSWKLAVAWKSKPWFIFSSSGHNVFSELNWGSQLKCYVTQDILLTYQFSLCVKPNSTKPPFLLLNSCFVILPDSPGVKGVRPWKTFNFVSLSWKNPLIDLYMHNDKWVSNFPPHLWATMHISTFTWMQWVYRVHTFLRFGKQFSRLHANKQD